MFKYALQRAENRATKVTTISGKSEDELRTNTWIHRPEITKEIGMPFNVVFANVAA